MSGESYLPSKDAELIEWGTNFVTKIPGYTALLGLGPQGLKPVTDTLAAFKGSYELTTGPDSTTVIVSQKNADRAAFEGEARALVNFPLKNPAVTDVIRTDLGLNVPKPHTREAAIPSHVVLELSHTQSGSLHCKAHDQFSANIAMLDAAQYGEVRVYINGQDGVQKKYTETFHTARFDLDIGSEFLGCHVTVEGRWRNNNNQVSPWGPAVIAVLS